MTLQYRTLFVLLTMILFSSCKENASVNEAQPDLALNETLNDVSINKEPSQKFKDYWYAGEAEITSYKLEQARYGEMREGHAVLIFVTEDFHAKKQVKADRTYPDNTSVLKLNATKNFNTGIYPYSIMQSTFYPVSNDQHATKVSSSMQEWCGHVYAQLNNRETFEAKATLTNNSYTLEYPTLKRSLVIYFDSDFPHTIDSWEESFDSGFGKNAKTLTTKATRLQSIKSPYWSKNSNADENLRKTLELEN